MPPNNNEINTKVPKRKLRFVIVVLIMVSIMCLYHYYDTRRRARRRQMRRSPCFLKTSEDLLPKAQSRINPLARNVFFIEKECEEFTPRLSCAVEAAANTNPEMKINVLFIGPAYNVRNLIAIQKKYPNVKFVRLYLQEFAQDSSLQYILNKKSLRKRRILQTRTLDVLKYWVLVKYGGIYLDKNMIVIGPLTKLTKNWVVKKSRYSFATEPIALVNDAVGIKFFNMISTEILDFFMTKQKWAKSPRRRNGPFDFSDLFEKVLKRFCSTSYTPLMTSKTCNGLKIHDQNKLYPPEWGNWAYYLEAGELDPNRAQIFPLLRNIPKENKILNTSRYAKMVHRFCPITAFAHSTRGDYEWLKDFKKEEYVGYTGLTREVITVN